VQKNKARKIDDFFISNEIKVLLMPLAFGGLLHQMRQISYPPHNSIL